MFTSIGLVVVPILVISYWRINRAREVAEQRRIEREKLELTIQELRDLGDRAPDFRYTLWIPCYTSEQGRRLEDDDIPMFSFPFEVALKYPIMFLMN